MKTVTDKKNFLFLKLPADRALQNVYA